jgi:hypothetical protein
MDKIIWDKWVSNWNWILEIAKKKIGTPTL